MAKHILTKNWAKVSKFTMMAVVSAALSFVFSLIVDAGLGLSVLFFLVLLAVLASCNLDLRTKQ